MRIDIHCHYTLSARRARADIPRFSFEPATRATGQPEYDGCVSLEASRRLSWRVMRSLLRIPVFDPPSERLDAALEVVQAQHLSTPALDRLVLLALDWYHDRDGIRQPLSPAAGVPGSDLYMSNSQIAAMCRRFPERYLFGASLHPYRANAVRLLDELFAGGACLLKWLPLHQNIDCADPRTIAVIRRCGELGLPLLVHYCEEFTLATHHREYRALASLLDVLLPLHRQGRMPLTIVAHAATPVTPFGNWSDYRALLAAWEGDFAKAPLYADTSALCAGPKVFFLQQLARRPSLHPRLLHGSDFPVPPAPLLANLLWQGQRDTASWPRQCLETCRDAGLSDIVFTQAAELLPNVHYFTQSRGGVAAAEAAA